MAPKNSTLTPTVINELVITRIFQASRAVAFKLWTEPRHLALWWGPRGFTNPVCTVDVRVGGTISIDMKGPDGIVYPMTGVFEEVIAEERIVFTAHALDEIGRLCLIVRNTITFEDNGGYTKLTLLAQVTKVTTQGERYLAGMQEGWNQSLDRLFNRVLSSETLDRELIMSRLLNAPRKLVFKVWTDPDHNKNWWGPDGFTNTITKMDVRPGGEWEFVMHGPDGRDYRNKTIFREVVEPERIVFDHVTAPKFRTTITFEDYGTKTLLTWKMVFESKEQYEQTVKTFGADEGLKQNLERLDAYVTSNV